MLDKLKQVLTGRRNTAIGYRTSGKAPRGATVNSELEQPWLHEFDECCTIEDVYYCFRLLLGRNPSEPEWPGHSGHAGSRLSSVVAQYLDSPEFKARQLSSFDSGGIELVNLPDFKMYVPKFDPLVGRHIYASKTYEPPVTDILRRLLQPGDFFVDVGANIGFFSLLAAQLVGKQGHVFAFEPFSQNVKLFYLSQQVNKFEQIDLFPIAVSDRSKLYLYDNAGTTGVISQLSSDFQRVMDSTIVYSVSLDKWLSSVKRLDCIKIDVDGAEGLVITGALELLRRHKPYVVCEFGPDAIQMLSRISPADFLRLLQVSPEYEFYVLHEAGPISCQQNTNRVMELYAQHGGDHVDILAAPGPLRGCAYP